MGLTSQEISAYNQASREFRKHWNDAWPDKELPNTSALYLALGQAFVLIFMENLVGESWVADPYAESQELARLTDIATLYSEGIATAESLTFNFEESYLINFLNSKGK